MLVHCVKAFIRFDDNPNCYIYLLVVLDVDNIHFH